ncbi:MAG: hypothetical protein OQK57_07060 [Ignavibacteriaceae bacterium]|nr:hypothetical protein [Ignavibacteriaceae bacterium]
MIRIILLLTALIYLNAFGQSDSIPSGDVSQSEEKIYDSRIHFTFGWFLPSIKSSGQLNTPSGGIGATINLETAFKLPETRSLFRFQGLYRFNNASSVDLYYYELNRSGSSKSLDSLVFGKLVIRVGADLESLFNVSLFGGRYHYSIVNNKDFESGFSAGISFLDLNMGASARILNLYAEESYKDLLFLPVFGFFNRVNFWNDFTLRNHIDLFALDIGRYAGTLFDFAISLEYSFQKYISIGAAYDAFSLDVDFNTGKTGRIQYGHRGFIFFATVMF